MSLSELTDRSAVRRALREFREIGREKFLSKYGFEAAREYFVSLGGRLYDSKAIVGAAYGYQYPKLGPLKANKFAGGEATVKRRLEALGFDVINPGRAAAADKRPRNPKWSRNELILALDLYLKRRALLPGKRDPEVVRLSDRLRSMGKGVQGHPDPEKYRNPNGVALKLQNFRRFDLGPDQKGMTHGGRDEKNVWEEFSSEPSKLQAEVKRIVRAFLRSNAAQKSQPETDSKASISPKNSHPENGFSIRAAAEALNSLAEHHAIGTLQSIRARLHNLRPRTQRLFSTQTINEDDGYAFHDGGRRELQFNIGTEERDGKEIWRHGVAFSLELSRSLTSLDDLIPKLARFNVYINENGHHFRDMKMWIWDKHEHGADFLPAPIPREYVHEGVFIFLGKRLETSDVTYESVLEDFDRLLPCYEYVESHDVTPVPQGRQPFTFRPGVRPRAIAARFTRAAQEVDLDLRHNRLQHKLFDELASEFGNERVSAEQETGVRTRIDMVVDNTDGLWLYEIKVASSAKACIRDALGQLLEYSYWPGGPAVSRVFVAGEPAIDEEAHQYLTTLQRRFSLPIFYRQISLQSG